MDGQMAKIELDISLAAVAPTLKVQCHPLGIIIFLVALLLDGGIGSGEVHESDNSFLKPSLTVIGIDSRNPKEEGATEGTVFTNGFGAQPRLFEPPHEKSTAVIVVETTTVVHTRNISPTHSTFHEPILETKLKDKLDSKVTNGNTVEHVETEPLLQNLRLISRHNLDMQTVSSSNYFLSTSLSDYTISSSIVQTDSLPVNAFSSYRTEQFGLSPTTPLTTVLATEITIKPVTFQSMDSSVHSSPFTGETVDISNSQKHSIHFSSLATSISSTPTLVGTTVQYDQIHGEKHDRMYDDEVIVALPGVADSENNVIVRMDQAHEYVSLGVTFNSTSSANNVMAVTAPALVMTSPPDSVSDRQEPSSESQVRKEESHIAAGTIAGIVVASIGFAAIVAAALGFAVFRRLHILRNKSYDNKFSNDTCSYLDSLQVSYINSHIDIPKESNDEMFSLDNDSFLNSLEAMTMENYWAEDSRNTKV